MASEPFPGRITLKEDLTSCFHLCPLTASRQYSTIVFFHYPNSSLRALSVLDRIKHGVGRIEKNNFSGPFQLCNVKILKL